MSGSFEKIRDSGVGVDVQRRADAEIALKRMEFRHGNISLSEEFPPFAAKQIQVTAVRGLADRTKRTPAHPKVSHAQPP